MTNKHGVCAGPAVHSATLEDNQPVTPDDAASFRLPGDFSIRVGPVTLREEIRERIQLRESHYENKIRRLLDALAETVDAAFADDIELYLETDNTRRPWKPIIPVERISAQLATSIVFLPGGESM